MCLRRLSEAVHSSISASAPSRVTCVVPLIRGYYRAPPTCRRPRGCGRPRRRPPPGWRVGAQAAAGGPRRAWAYTPAMKLETSLVQDVTAAGLRVVVDSVRAAVAARGRAVLALSGGSTPLPLYRALADQDLPWERVWVAFGDERFVRSEERRVG